MRGGLLKEVASAALAVETPQELKALLLEVFDQLQVPIEVHVVLTETLSKDKDGTDIYVTDLQGVYSDKDKAASQVNQINENDQLLSIAAQIHAIVDVPRLSVEDLS